MKQIILNPMGRVEPDDVRGWLEHSGGLGLQLAWRLSPAELRARLSHIRRRDGKGLLETVPVPTAAVMVDLVNPVQRTIAAEMPAFIIEGALIWARACEQTTISVQMRRDKNVTTLWREVVETLQRLGITGAEGWTETTIKVTSKEPAKGDDASLSPPDSLTTRLIPLALWEHGDPAVTLLQAAGNFGNAGVFEIPLGITVREFVFEWAGGIPPNSKLSLGGNILRKKDWDLPLTYDQWGTDLGSGLIKSG